MAEKRPWPVVLSARSEQALQAAAWQMSTWLEIHSKLNGAAPLLPEITYMLGARRNHHAHRLAVTANSMLEISQEFAAFATGDAGPKLRTAFAPRRQKAPGVAFVMSGQGPQWWGMGRELMRNEPVFRQMIEDCDRAMQPWSRISLLEELARSEEDSQMQRTEVSQPAIFAIQMGLAELWRSWGIQPSAVVGHSVGEVAAACVAGILTLEQAAKVIVLRGRLMDECPAEGGTMLAVGLSRDEASALLDGQDRDVSIAAINGPRSLTLSGPRIALERIASNLESEGAFARFLQVSHPFHHAAMQPAADGLLVELEELKPRIESLPFFSTVTGKKHDGAACDAGHWSRGVRQPVEFASSIAALEEFGVDIWLEIGAHPALVRSIRECLADSGQPPIILASMRREREQESLLETAMDLHLAGVELDFSGLSPSRRHLALPTYPWDRTLCWQESSESRLGRLGPGGKGILDVRLPRAMPTWIARLDGRHMAFLKDHRVENLVIFPAAGFVEMVLEAGQELFEGDPFVLEDFEIRKPLILPEPPSGLVLELTCDPREGTFTIQSRFENGTSWSLHAVGSIRGERTDSTFTTSNWEKNSSPELDLIALETFYNHMSDLGLRYGDEFRPIRTLRAGGGQAEGRISLGKLSAPRASEYPLHPVLFDGALQVFSAAASTIEGRTAGLRLPVRFARIEFLRSPGESSLTRAVVKVANDELVEGGIELFDEDGKPCVRIDGFRAISVEGARRTGRTGKGRDLTYHISWENRVILEQIHRDAPIPLGRLHEVASQALDEVLDLRGREHLGAASLAGERLTEAQVAQGLRGMGVKSKFTADSLGVAASMKPSFEQLTNDLTQQGLLTQKGCNYRVTPAFLRAADSAPELLARTLEKFPGHLPEALLSGATCAELGPIMRGELEAVQVLFASGGSDLLDQFYGDSPVTSPWLAAIGCAVEECARHLPKERGLRILEIGAGTGGLASQVLPLLERHRHSYLFSDVSSAFFPGARQKLAAYEEVDFKVFDLELPGAEQGLTAGSFDLILGTNVIHAAADVHRALSNLQDLLMPGGSLLFVEVASPHLWLNAVFGTDGLFHLAQELGNLQPSTKLHLDLVTRGTQATSPGEVMSVAGAACIGLMRVVANEYPNLACRSIDLPLIESSTDDWLLWNELRQTDAEREVAFRGEARLVRRIHRGLQPLYQRLGREVPLRLETRERGLLDALSLAPFKLPSCGPGEVSIEVKAAGMNFRDVLKALALYPAETADARVFGDEVAGIVTHIGEGVMHVAPGDRVFGLAVFGLATHAMARAGDVRIIPAGLSMEEAATLPVVFMTSWHALHTVANLRKGERILIHAGAGGIGMAAIQLAHHLGAEVIASAGSPAKRALLRVLGVKQVIDSRRADFADTVREWTNGRGVDVVLNALAGEAIPMGLSCLAPFGRFIEIGKRDIYQNSRIPLWPLRQNASFHVIAMDAIFGGDEDRTRDLLETVADLIEQEAIHPLPYRSFPACRVDTAFRLMAQGKHTGKVIVSFPEPFIPRHGEPLPPGFTVSSEGCYLITGAFGGFGKVIAGWLADCGARHLVLTSRNGASTPEAVTFLLQLRGRGVEVRVVLADVGASADVTGLLSGIAASDRPLLGVFHLAMAIDDAPLATLTRERMCGVLAPKARGAWLLHEGTKELKLDCFVMFSSVSSIFGNAGQANYAAANAVLDSLAHYRRGIGLPALVINWGALGGEGYVARNERIAEYLARQGTSPLSPSEVVFLLESFLAAGATQAMALRVDWSRWRQSFRGSQESPLLEHIFSADEIGPESSGPRSDWRIQIRAASPENRPGLVSQAVREVVGSVLRVKPEGLRLDQPLTDLGLDSLMAVEIENSIESVIGVALPPASLMRARTIGQIAQLITEQIGGSERTAPPIAPALKENVIDLEALTDAEIAHILGEDPADPSSGLMLEGRG
jgi:acyl transferase domain-containing protein/NADPH:quinone reductase-like Zn-dependent oxidoreductase/acyl carrier protein/ubiquinone/menaquinone biosynthesis C-methylase UbiE